MAQNNPFISVIIGIILILLWIPASFWSEINNKGNRKEQSLLKKNIDNLKITLVTLNDKDQEYNYDTLTIKGSHYLIKKETIEKTDNNGKKYTQEEVSDEIHNNIDGLSDNNINKLSDYNFIYLAKKNNPVTHNNGNIKYEIYSISNLKLQQISGLLDSTETETDNKYGIPIYEYEYGNIEEIKKTILKRKTEDNIIQKWVGRLLVFLALFIGLVLLIAPIEEFKDTIKNWFPLISGLLDLVIQLYTTLSFGFSLILTIVLTTLVYLLVNYPLIAVAGIGLGVGGYVGKNLVKNKKTN